MLYPEEQPTCQNCENLRVDNFCLTKMKYILSKNVNKKRECSKFTLKQSMINNRMIRKEERKRIISNILNQDTE